MKSNLDINHLEALASIVKDIYTWSTDKSHSEKYANVTDPELVREFLYTLDLLETVLTRFAVSTHLTQIALEQMENSTQPGSLNWEFWQIDVEEFFASTLLELCYQLSNAWDRLQQFGNKEAAFGILRKNARKPSDIILARHKATHFQPGQFEDHRI